MISPNEYARLFNSATVTASPSMQKELSRICAVILTNQKIYAAVQRETRSAYGVEIPFPLVAAIHFRESDLNFNCHLHNGDSLSARTIHEPKGRPQRGDPPFTWIESAVDAFSGTWYPIQWDISGCLEFLERYNGLGYQKHSIYSPYLWDQTDKYSSGLYMADGVFNILEKENRPGCVALLKTLQLKGVKIDSLINYAGPTVH